MNEAETRTERIAPLFDGEEREILRLVSYDLNDVTIEMILE
jgi:hypothetical protein